METLIHIFGQGKELSMVQMSMRGIAMFLIALLLIRISGRRSFGQRDPLDNIIIISLGSIMSRAVVGASAFGPVMVCCLVIVLLHRFFSWMITRSKILSRVVHGEKILLYGNGRFQGENMKHGLVSREDILQGIRETALTDDLELIDKVYMERDGKISAVKRSEQGINQI